MIRPFLAATLISTAIVTAAANYTLSSPDRQLVCEISTCDSILFSIRNTDGRELLAPSTVAMEWSDGSLWGKEPKRPRVRKTSHDATIPSPFYKKALVNDRYEGLELQFKDFGIEFRLYDDGAAYRFINTHAKKGEVRHETAIYRLPGNPTVWGPFVRNRKKKSDVPHEQLFWNDMQNHYTVAPFDSFPDGRLFFTPLLADNGSEKIVFAEADVESYPGMYLAADTANKGFRGVSAPYPANTAQGGHNDLEMLVTGREDFIAKVDGKRTFPWRAFIVSREDTELPANDMVYRLASPCRLADTSWIKPGKVAWEWWNDWGLYGVNFKAGVNTDTYKAYIDFASDKGIEYVILDEGWATKGRCDLFDIVSEIDMPKLINYANSKNVGIILWAGYLAFARDIERVVSHYSAMGVKGFKIDFLNRDDQEMLDFMYRTAEACGRHRMLVDFHGCAKPTGLQRTYPNVINYEAVFGLEQMKWSKPGTNQIAYDVTLPFIRSIAGPMDYTQGAMRNAAYKQYYPCRSNPMSQGTRCRQLAEFVVFDSPLAMLCDSPSNYEREPECTAFIASVPTVFERTEVLTGKLGEYIAIARQASDGTWYIGAMTGHESRNIGLPLSFLDKDKTYEMTSYSDGPNADKQAQDFTVSRRTVGLGDIIEISMQPGGGYAAVLSVQK